MLAPPPSPSSASSTLTVDASLAMGMANEEEDNNSNIFALLMPNLYGKLELHDEAVSEQELQEIKRLLDRPTSGNDGIKDSLLTKQPSALFKQKENYPGTGEEGMKEKDTQIVKSVYGSGKENANKLPQISGNDGMKDSLLTKRPLALFKQKENDPGAEEMKEKDTQLVKSVYASGKETANKLPQRNKISRRERSSRIATHRKPFVVDLRTFGSLLNSNALGECKKPQDVHAFWDAADEREASEAIMSKLRRRTEPCSHKNESDHLVSRRLAVRRKNSHRTTTRLRRFLVELPSCADQVQSVDEMQLEEEEEDGTDESSFTFLSNPELRAQSHLYEQYNAAKDTNVDQSVAISVEVKQEGEHNDISLAVMPSGNDQEGDDHEDGHEDDHEILSDGNCPPINLEGASSWCGFGETEFAASKGGSGECVKESRSSAIEIPTVDRASQLESDLAIIPQNSHLAAETYVAAEVFMKSTPYNRKIAANRTPCTSPTPPSNPLAVFGLKKNNVVEDISRRLDFDDSIESPSPELDLPAPTVEDTNCPLYSTADASGKEVKENKLDSAKEVEWISTSPVLKGKSPEKNVTKSVRKVSRKRKKPLADRRNSLAAAGTKLDNGTRRSTRIRSRPLEWWRGERFLLGRVHKSLTTVIGIKYSSPPPCWPKRGAKPPPFKVESYVSEKYADIVQFAAL